jgi:hypothetical protein
MHLLFTILKLSITAYYTTKEDQKAISNLRHSPDGTIWAEVSNPADRGTKPVGKRLISIICFTHTCQVFLETFTIYLFLESTHGKQSVRMEAVTEKVKDGR